MGKTTKTPDRTDGVSEEINTDHLPPLQNVCVDDYHYTESLRATMAARPYQLVCERPCTLRV
jgi:hypothetical protein